MRFLVIVGQLLTALDSKLNRARAHEFLIIERIARSSNTDECLAVNKILSLKLKVRILVPMSTTKTMEQFKIKIKVTFIYLKVIKAASVVDVNWKHLPPKGISTSVNHLLTCRKCCRNSLFSRKRWISMMNKPGSDPVIRSICLSTMSYISILTRITSTSTITEELINQTLLTTMIPRLVNTVSGARLLRMKQSCAGPSLPLKLILNLPRKEGLIPLIDARQSFLSQMRGWSARGKWLQSKIGHLQPLLVSRTSSTGWKPRRNIKRGKLWLNSFTTSLEYTCWPLTTRRETILSLYSANISARLTSRSLMTKKTPCRSEKTVACVHISLG